MALLAISPGAIEYAQEARSYSLLLLLAMAIIGIAVEIVAKPAATPARWALLTISGILGSHTHYFVLLLAVTAAFVTFVNRSGPARRCLPS